MRMYVIQLSMRYLRILDYSVDDALQELQDAVDMEQEE